MNKCDISRSITNSPYKSGSFCNDNQKKNAYITEKIFWQRVTMDSSLRKDVFQNSNLIQSDGEKQLPKIFLHRKVQFVICCLPEIFIS